MGRYGINVDNIRKEYKKIVQSTNWDEFLTALVIAERAYTIDDISELTDDEIIQVANMLDMYDTIFNRDINYDLDSIINIPREDY